MAEMKRSEAEKKIKEILEEYVEALEAASRKGKNHHPDALELIEDAEGLKRLIRTYR